MERQMKNEGYLLLIAVIIFIGVMLIVSGEDWQYGNAGDLRGTQSDYGINKTLVQEISDSVNITKAIEDFDKD